MCKQDCFALGSVLASQIIILSDIMFLSLGFAVEETVDHSYSI